MRELPVLQAYERPDRCGPCGGHCCKQLPGSAMPSDFGSSEHEIRTNLKTALASGNWAIDWWEGDPRPYDEINGDSRDQGYFIRPRVAEVDSLFDPTFGGRCTFLRLNGCAIFEKRPSGCRGLEPGDSPPSNCLVRHSSKQDAAIAWIPYHQLILSVASEVEND